MGDGAMLRTAVRGRRVGREAVRSYRCALLKVSSYSVCTRLTAPSSFVVISLFFNLVLTSCSSADRLVVHIRCRTLVLRAPYLHLGVSSLLELVHER